MSDRFQSAEVPFQTVRNRRCLTELQLLQNPYLADFVKRFPDSFELDALLNVLWFIEPEMNL